MSQKIYMNTETLHAKAEEIHTYAQQHVEIMQNLTNLVLTMSESWEGNAQKEFEAKYQGMNEYFAKFDEALFSFADLLEQVTSKMEQADQDMANKISAITA